MWKSSQQSGIHCQKRVGKPQTDELLDNGGGWLWLDLLNCCFQKLITWLIDKERWYYRVNKKKKKKKNTRYFLVVIEIRLTCDKSKVGDRSRGGPEGSLFNSYYTKLYGEGATPFSGLLHFTFDVYLIMLSVKQGNIKYHFWVFVITRRGIEPWSPGPLANTLLIRPKAKLKRSR